MSNTGPTDASVIISYVEENDAFKTLEKELRPVIPFKGVKWTIKDGRPPEVCLDIVPRFIPDEKATRTSTSDTPAPSAHQEPYLRLYVVSCEDAEQYRSQIKARIQKWHIPEAEQLIIHVSQKEPGFFSKNVFQLMKTDFGGPRSDRVIQLKLSGYEKAQQLASFDEVVSRIRESISKSGQRTTEDLQKKIRKLDSERMQKGWNFSTFFATKESLALVYESLAMYEDAYAQYEELETLFLLGQYQFSTFGATEEADDSGSVLNYNRKNYRSRLFDSSISEFDFRMYLFARQAHLLFRLSKPSAVAVRAISFIENMLNVFSRNGMEPEFGWAWAFSAYIDVAESCRANAILRQLSAASAGKERDSDPKIPTMLNSMLGDLYFSACQSLWKLGVSFCLIPRDTFFLFGPDSHEVDPRYSVGNETLAEKYDPYVPLVPTRESLSNILALPSNTSNLSLATVNSFSPASSSDILEFNQMAAADSPLKSTKHRRQPSIIESVNLSDETISSISLSDKTKRARQSKTPARTGPRSTLTHRRQRSADGALNLSSKLAAAAFISEGSTPLSSGEDPVSIVPNLTDSVPEHSEVAPHTEHDSIQHRVSTSPLLGRSSARDGELSPNPVGTENSSPPSAAATSLDKQTVDDNAPIASNQTFLPRSFPPTSQLAGTGAHPPTLKSTHPSLSTALVSAVGFDRVFLSVATKAKQSLRESGRERSVNRMTLDVAELHFIRGRYSEALECFKLCLNKFLIDTWIAETAVLFPLECKIAECARQLDLPDESTLALILLLASKNVSLASSETFAYFMEELDSSARFGLDESLMLSATPAFDVQVDVRAADAVIPVDQPAVVNVTITSSLALPITMDRVAVRFGSRATQTRPTRQLVLEAVDVDVLPGTNKVRLSCNGTKGKFKLENCILQFGQVVFGQEYPQSSTLITVKASAVTADLDIAMPESMVFDNTQHLQVVIVSNNDSMFNVVLRATANSEPSPQILHAPVTKAWKSVRNGAQMAEVSVEAKAREILVPDLEAGGSLTLFIPCIFTSRSPLLVQDASMNFVSHQGVSSEVEVCLEYRNAAREKKIINKTFDLSFIHPMEAKAYAVITDVASKYLICVCLRSRSPVPLQLLRYHLGSPSQDSCVLSDIGKEANILGTIIRSKETMSLSFSVETNSDTTLLELSLDFLLKDKQLTSLEQYGFNTKIKSNLSIQVRTTKPNFVARIEHAGAAEVGVASFFRITIVASPHAAERLQTLPMFTICFDEACWAYAGLARGFVPLDSPLSFSACMVPLRPGSLPLPFVKLESPFVAGPLEISMSYSKEEFRASTPPKTFALLNQLEGAYWVS
eukprot:TRINITY_DN648_c0_g3_i1.p1 TRINITY_DN648_c0_g3~~TRINITY_DN648_c0_g3_i1.p1  ORF type:complete len:1335 (-),score=198.95 TRINITY_DN648_c0_g3_i1:2270-6274(-)